MKRSRSTDTKTNVANSKQVPAKELEESCDADKNSALIRRNNDSFLNIDKTSTKNGPSVSAATERYFVSNSASDTEEAGAGNSSGNSAGGLVFSANSAFRRLQRSQSESESDSDSDSDSDSNSGNNNIISARFSTPLIEFIEGIGGDDETPVERERESIFSGLPHAYPINVEPYIADVTPDITQGAPVDSNSSGLRDNLEDEEEGAVEEQYPHRSNVDEKKSFISREALMCNFSILLIGLLIFSLSRVYSKGSVDDEASEASTGPFLSGISNHSTISPTLSSTFSPSFSPTLSQTISPTTSPKCFRDPILIHNFEHQANERGDDPSIPRTYVICPNSTMNVFWFDQKLYNFDYSSGNVHPLVLFRPNVNILCGFDGDYANNCTFNGGFFQVILNFRSLAENYDSNSTAQNITIEGFRFTGVQRGFNVLNRNRMTSVVIKNSRFYNNHEMLSSIFTTRYDTVLSAFDLQNCTFDSNTYSYLSDTYTESVHMGGVRRTINNLGVIGAFPPPDSNGVVQTYISGCMFSNNTFLIDESEKEVVTGAIINLLPPISTVQVTDSCFIGNKDYSSGLILLGTWNGVTSEHYSGNYFLNNEPSKFHNTSCAKNYQNSSFNDDGSVALLTLQETCADYAEEENRKPNLMCTMY